MFDDDYDPLEPFSGDEFVTYTRRELRNLDAGREEFDDGDEEDEDFDDDDLDDDEDEEDEEEDDKDD
jgi:DNA-directed RNA polymerase subunit delta